MNLDFHDDVPKVCEEVDMKEINQQFVNKEGDSPGNIQVLSEWDNAKVSPHPINSSEIIFDTPLPAGNNMISKFSFCIGTNKKSPILFYSCMALVVVTTLILVAFALTTAVGYGKVSKLETELMLAQMLDKQTNEPSMPTTNAEIMATTMLENEVANYTHLVLSLLNPYSRWINILTRNTVLTEIIKNCVEGDLFGNSSLTKCIDFVAVTYGISELIPAASCEEIHIIQPANSGYYWVTSSNGSSIRVYCEMTLTCANKTGGLTRVFVLDYNSKTQYCTGDVKFDGIGCVRTSSEPGCAEMSFPLPNIPYSHVCGSMRGRWFGYPDGYSGRSSHTTINDNYVDGISFTYNISSHRNHLWTFSATRGNCSQNIPDFVGTHHSCLAYTLPHITTIFTRYFQQPVPDSIEVRLCQDQHRDADFEGVYLENLELYVW